VWTTRPSRVARTRIWQESREFGLTSKAKVEHVLFHGLGLAHRLAPFLGDIDVARRAGAGAAAFRLDPGDAVAHRVFHHGGAFLGLDRPRRAVRIHIGNLDHHAILTLAAAPGEPPPLGLPPGGLNLAADP
jgi:hypothetical protein